MINPILKRIFVIVMIFCILIIGFLVYMFNFYTLPASSTNGSGWSDFNKWFEWKVTTNLTEEQKNVIEYLNKSTTMFDKAFKTECVNPESKYGYPDPKEAIKIVQQAIAELEKLPYPKLCENYRNLSIKNMIYIISYHKMRLEYKEGTEKFDEKHRELEINFIKSGIDSERYSDFFYCIKKIGLFDSYKKEIKNFQVN